MISKEDVIAWKNDPVTRMYLESIEELRKEIESIILEGGFLRSREIEREYSYHIGLKDGLDKVLDIELLEVNKDETGS